MRKFRSSEASLTRLFSSREGSRIFGLRSFGIMHVNSWIFPASCHFYTQTSTTDILDVLKVSLQFQKFVTKANEKTDEWKLLQNDTNIFKFILPYLIYRYMGIISCTKRIKTVLDFLHDRYFPPRCSSSSHSSLYRTLSLFP